MVIPALPELQAEFHADPADATWLLTAFLLTSSVATPLLGRLGDMHGKERWLLISLAIFGVGSLIAPLGGSLAVLITGRADAGRGRRDLPAGHRDHPRRVPARARGARDRHGFGDVRHRRRRGARARRALRRPRLDLVDLLALGGRPRRWPRSRRGAGCPSRPCACARASTGSAAGCCRSCSSPCCCRSARATRGAGPRPACSALFAAAAVLAVVVGVVGAAGHRPARGPRTHAPASRVDDERRRLRHRLRDVRFVRPHPPVRADARPRPGTGSTRRSPSPGCSCCRRPC